MKYYISAILFALTIYLSFGQKEDALLTYQTTRFHKLDINNGLSHTDAICFDQDTMGFIWIGTNYGLQRYNGNTLQSFTNNNSLIDMPFHNRITALHCHNQNLWVGTEKGVQLFDLSTLSFRHLKVAHKESGLRIQSIYVDRGSNIWIATTNSLLIARYNQENDSLNIEHINSAAIKTPKAIENITPKKILGDNCGSIWINDGTKLYRFTCDKSGHISFNRIVNGRNQLKLGIGAIDIFIRQHRLFVLSKNSISIINITPEKGVVSEHLQRIIDLDKMKINGITSKQKAELRYGRIVIDLNNQLWLSTNMGLLKFNRPNVQSAQGIFFVPSLTDPYAISETRLTDIFLDISNTLWIGSYSGGANFLSLNINPFYTITHHPDNPSTSLIGYRIKDLDVDTAGNVWIATSFSGISKFSPHTGRLTHYMHNPKNNNSLSNNGIYSLKVSPENKIVIGTTEGLDIYDPIRKKFTHHKRTQNYGDKMVRRYYGMDFDSLGQLWTGSWGDGLNRFVINNDNSINVTNWDKSGKNGFKLSSNYINFVYVNKSKNEVFLATRNGIDRLFINRLGNITKLISYRADPDNANSLNSNYIWPISKINDSTYWIGTFSGGLNKVTFTTQLNEYGLGIHHATHYNKEAGLENMDIEGLLYDDLGRIWISGNGLAMFDPSTKKTLTFDVYDGLHNNSFKVGAAVKSNDGLFYFGGLNGLTFFNPLDINPNPYTTMVKLSSFQVGNRFMFAGDTINHRILLHKDISFTKSITLKHNENDFSIGFSSLQYANPSQCRFRYMLEGYDDEWNDIGADRPIADYSNLKFGAYTFKVFGSNNSGIWSKNPEVLSIEVLPPWWLTKTAYFFYFLLCIIIIYGFYLVMSKMISMKNNLKLQEQLHQMKMQFFTNISHEFRTPLTLILSPLQDLLQGNVPIGNYPRVFNTMYKNTQRLLNLVNDLMDFRKAEVGGMDLHARKLDINTLLKDIYNQFKEHAVRQEIAFNIELSDNPLYIWGDPDKVNTIFFNLLSNAFKYTPHQGCINIKSYSDSEQYFLDKNLNSFFVTSGKKAEKYIAIEVSDTGIGISKESMPNIFDRFYQVDGQNSHLHLGSGIGLALTKNLVLLHHGEIGLTSIRNKGSKFIVKFPLGISHLEDDQLLSSSETMKDENQPRILIEPDNKHESLTDLDLNSAKTKEATVLLVEDDEQLRTYLKGKLNTLFNVLCAEDGSKGVDICRKQLPDVIVTDLMMPIMDGLEMTRLLKNDPMTCHIPVIMLTAKSSVDNTIEGAEAGGDIYLNKPIDVRLLNARIQSLISNRKRMLKKYSNDALFYVRKQGIEENEKEFIIKLEEVIITQISDPEFDIKYICNSMNMGRTNLYQKVKSVTDMTLGDFVKNVRLKKAVEIMLSKDVSIAEVAYMVGMSSPSYFTKTFKKKFNKTPAQFLDECSSK